MMLRIESDTNLNQEIIDKWQELWDQVPDAHFFNSPGYTIAFLDAFPQTELKILFVYDDDRLIVVLPLMKTKKFGIRVWACPDRPQNFLDRSALLCSEDFNEFVTEFLRQLAKIGNIFLADSTEKNLSFFKQSINLVWENSLVCPRAKIAGDCLENMPSKRRREMKRRIKKIDNKLSFKFHQPAQAALLDQVIEIEKLSDKPKKGIALFDDPDSRRLYGALVKHCPQNVAIGMLYYEEKPIASAFGLVFNGTFLCTHMVFCSEHSKLGPGKMLVCFVLDELKKRGFKAFDFSKGDSKLKREFTNEFPIQYNLFFSANILILLWWKLFLLLKRSKRLLRHLVFK